MLDKTLAALDPAAVFATPEAVRDHAELTADEKVEILRRWAYDDSETAVAVEEGMPEHGESESDLQRRILLAVEALGGELDFEHAGPSKHHGVPAPGTRRPR